MLVPNLEDLSDWNSTGKVITLKKKKKIAIP